MGHGLDHFRKEGAKLIPPPTGDDPYADEAYRLWATKQRGNVLIWRPATADAAPGFSL